MCAYLQVAGTWADLAQLSQDLHTDLPAGELVAFPTRVSDPSYPGAAARHSNLWRRATWAAAGMLAVAIACGFAWRLWLSTYSTGIDEQRTVVLEDGSHVRLNSRSKIRVRLTSPRREIDLLEGQAMFAVAQDPKRPFIVTSRSVTVRAVGTAFDVNLKATGTVVTVLEGRVAVEMLSPSTGTHAGGVASPTADSGGHVVQAGGSSGGEWLVPAGEQLAVSSSGTVEPQRSANVAAATSWLQGELTFSGQPLSDVVEEFNRHSRRPIVITDSTLAGSRISAVFHSTNVESLIRYLRRLEGVDVEETGTEIRVSRRPPP